MTFLHARTIAIIGSGPSGFAAAKYLRAEKYFHKIDIFEQRSRGGGIWNHTPDDIDEDIFSIPQTDPRGKNQDPTWKSSGQNFNNPGDQNGSHAAASFLSPIYDKLETNIPRGLMGFQDLDWPQDSHLFPKHETVLQYVEEYGREVRDLVSYETQVIDVAASNEDYDGSWTVKVRELRSNKERVQTYDAVIVANGHFIVPHVPDVPGIKEWNKKFPGSITHSKYFRRPEQFVGKKVVVVGNSASGVDISSQIAAFSQLPLLWSIRSASMLSPTEDSRRCQYPPIAEFLPDIRAIRFEDGNTETEIDAIVFATGYYYSLPFLKTVQPALTADGSHVQNTYQHIFYAPRPTLSFLVLNQRIIPFPMAESQSAILARVYSGRLSLPPLLDMRRWEEDVIAERGNGKNFHLLPFPKDGNYINELSSWALTSVPKEGLENEGMGKRPPMWGDWEFWCRGNFPAIRSAYGARGVARHAIRSLDELGFNYAEHVRHKDGVDGGQN